MKFMATPSTTGIGVPERIEAGIERIAETAHGAKLQIMDKAASAARQMDNTGENLMALQERWSGAAVRCVRKHPVTSAGVVLAAVALIGAVGMLWRRPPPS